MADTKISALTELTAPVAGDFIPIVDTSAVATKKLDWDLVSLAFNVKAYGATGDGVTDDTSAIQSALSAVPADGGVVYLPEGDYVISGMLEIPRYTTFMGAGHYATKIIQANSTNLTYIIRNESTNGYEGIVLKDFYIDGGYDGSNTAGTGIYFSSISGTRAYDLIIERVKIRKCPDYAIQINNCNHVIINECYLSNNLSGGIDGFDYVTGSINNTVVEFNANYDIRLDGTSTLVSAVSINDCHFETTTTPYNADNIIQVAVRGVAIRGCKVNGSDLNTPSAAVGSCISVEDTGDGCTIQDSYFVTPTNGYDIYCGTNAFFQHYLNNYYDNGVYFLWGTQTYTQNGASIIRGDGGTDGGITVIDSKLRTYPRANGSRGTASDYPSGTVIFNSTTYKPNWSDGTDWRDSNGALDAFSYTSSTPLPVGWQNTIIDNNGAVAIRTWTLPVSVPGMEYIFVRDNATYALRIDPASSEGFTGATVDKYKSLDSDGAYLHVRCYVAGSWHVLFSGGTIGDEP